MKFIAASTSPPHNKQENKKRTNAQFVDSKKSGRVRRDPQTPLLVVWKTPWYTRILIFVSLAVLIYLVFETFMPLLKFQIYIQWWNKNGGKEYRDHFSIYKLAYFQNFSLYYYIGNLGGNQLTSFNKQQALFIMEIIQNFAKLGPDEGDPLAQFHQVLPKQICKTIVPDSYVSFFSFPLDDEGSWKKKFQEWGYPDPSSPEGSSRDAITQNLDVNKWTSAQDNFLYHAYNIPGQSAMLLDWYTGTGTGEIGKDFSSAFPIAMGMRAFQVLKLDIGGWWGYCQFALTTTASFGDMLDYVYNRKDISAGKGGPEPQDSGCDGLSTAGDVFQKASAGAMAGSAGGAIGAIIGGLVGLGLSLAQTGTKCWTGKK